MSGDAGAASGRELTTWPTSASATSAAGTPCRRAAHVRQFFESGARALAVCCPVDVDGRPAVVLDLAEGGFDPLDPAALEARPAPTSRNGSSARTPSSRSASTARTGTIYRAPQFDPATAERRTVHIAVDIFLAAGTPVLAPLDGVAAVSRQPRAARLRRPWCCSSTTPTRASRSGRSTATSSASRSPASRRRTRSRAGRRSRAPRRRRRERRLAAAPALPARDLARARRATCPGVAPRRRARRLWDAVPGPEPPRRRSPRRRRATPRPAAGDRARRAARR